MSHSMDVIRADFDRLAAFYDEGWNHNNHYHRFLLQHIPAHLDTALDIGCGTGEFTRLLAERADHVVGIDLSPNMLQIAQQHAAQHANIRYEVADMQTIDLSPDKLDCIVSIATLHHLPLESTLLKMKTALKPGGILLVLDLFKNESFADLITSVLAVPASWYLKRIKRGTTKSSPQARAAWAMHGQHDTYLTLREVRRMASSVLPSAAVRRHLLWRYSLIWHKPG